ncbi:MAG: PQQ-binding-like beta-propeller repeat protein [Ilumatobacter sp.]|nr:PQQ-binding-like beta-propeller repeat protein [Ilumatobacter sp.]
MGEGRRSGIGAGDGVHDDAHHEDEPHDADDVRDADAPWRPDYDGWRDGAVRTAGRETAGSPLDSLLDEQSDADERWSREYDERPTEPWRPEPRRPRPMTPAPAPTGPPVASVEGQPVDTVTGELLLTGIVLAVVVVAALLTAAVVRPVSVAPPEPPALSVVPTSLETSWSIPVGAVVEQVGVGEGVVVATLSGDSDDAALVAFDLAGGTELWRRSVDLPARGADAVEVLGDRVVVERRSPGGATGVTVFDRLTGDEVWTADAEATYQLRGEAGRRFLVRLSRPDDVSLLELVSPVDGAIVGGPIEVGAVSVAGLDVVAQQFPREQVGIWSVEELATVAGPVPQFNLRTVAALDGAVVALDLERRIVAFDRDGNRIDERLFESDAFGEFRSRAELAGVVPGTGIGVVSSGSSLGFEVRDGRIETVWERPGRAGRPVTTAAGPVSLLVGPRGASGEIDDTLIDPRTGETLVVTDEGTTRETEPILGHEAYVAAPEIGAAERRLEAFNYDGQPLWDLVIEASAGYLVADGAVVVVERRPGDSTIVVTG